MESDLGGEEGSKKWRQRKKQLDKTILQQVEFYLSDSNLTKDRFFGQLLKDNEYLDVEIFLKCNKILKLTSSLSDLIRALKKSTILELSEDQTKIKRKTPFVEKTNIDKCTIYVQNIKADTTHEYLTKLFSDFGKVDYVSIPKYKNNNLGRGFAFIEFQEEIGAIKAVDYFESIDCKIAAQMAPEELHSIIIYEQNQKKNDEKSNEKNDEETNQINDVEMNEKKDEEMNEKKDVEMNEKKDEEMNEEKDEEMNEKKDEVINEKKGEDANEKKRKVEEDDSSQESKRLRGEDVKSVEDEVEDERTNVESKSKKKKMNKKKAQIKELGLQVLHKHEWKKMRNRYLNMQKAKMKQLKIHLNKCRFNNRFEEKKLIENETECKKDGENKQKDFIPGCIVKLKFTEPCTDTKKTKNEMKSMNSDIQYIEIPVSLNNDEAFLRFSNDESAKLFCVGNTKGKGVVLEGDEEAAYWQKINSSREVRLSKDSKKQRGRDKLLKKAERELGKHIRFDDAE